jgi:hypothetical protein
MRAQLPLGRFMGRLHSPALIPHNRRSHPRKIQHRRPYNASETFPQYPTIDRRRSAHLGAFWMGCTVKENIRRLPMSCVRRVATSHRTPHLQSRLSIFRALTRCVVHDTIAIAVCLLVRPLLARSGSLQAPRNAGPFLFGQQLVDARVSCICRLLDQHHASL